MKTNHTDEEISAAIDAACEETAEAHPYTSQLLTLENYRGSCYDREAPARLHLLKSALGHLPEPPPPVVDGKTPGQVAFEATAPCGRTWAGSVHTIQSEWEKLASAVLAVFGQPASLEAAIARMEAVPFGSLDAAFLSTLDYRASIERIRARLIAAAREGQPASQPAEIPWEEWNGGECPLKDEEVERWEYKVRNGEENNQPSMPAINYRWHHDFDGRGQSNGNFDIIAYRVLKWRDGHSPAAVDWKAKFEALEAQHVIASRAVDNILRILPELTKSPSWEDSATVIRQHIDIIQARAEKAEAELARMSTLWANQMQTVQSLQDQVEDLVTKPQLSNLRPIAEAGPVPTGCVRVYSYISPLSNCWIHWFEREKGTTHFADIRLPASQALATEAADPYAELKAAHAAGRVIQFRRIGSGDDWRIALRPDWSNSDMEYRIKPEPETFTAHGKTWIKHDGGPMPCDADDKIHILCQTIESHPPEIIQTGEDVDWSADLDLAVLGWRYADEPTPEPAKTWTPKVGDVVTLKSGGQKMTVVQVDGTDCRTMWFNGSTIDAGDFYNTTLQPA